MEFKTTSGKSHVRISISGRILSQYDAQPLLDAVKELVSEGKQYFILDLKKTEYINSEGLNVLLKILTKTRNVGGETVLCNISKELDKLFIITKLANIFNIKESVQKAEEFLKSKSEDSYTKVNIAI